MQWMHEGILLNLPQIPGSSTNKKKDIKVSLINNATYNYVLAHVAQCHVAVWL